MKINKRKSVKIKNRTNYFDPNSSKAFVQFSSPDSYNSRKQKIEGYENRLYWEYRYCDDHNGQTFFYTLTYNDAHLPKFEGQNCFDYNDLVYLLNGGFKKKLLRNYGTNFKYFVGAELGDGKGKRGIANNPHYHVLFFLRSADDPRYPYIKINPKDFRHLVRLYWQGFDEDVDGYKPYSEAKLGIAKEGENLGLVSDFRACMYCAKYVSKDVVLRKHEDTIVRKLKFQYSKQVFGSDTTKEDFFYEVVNPKFNIPKKAHLDSDHKDWMWSPRQLFHKLVANSSKYGVLDDYAMYDVIIDECNLHSDYKKYCDDKVDELVSVRLNEYRNRYCNKCRISQGVGDYALEFIKDKLNPTIQVPKKNGWKNRPIGLYYYRKLYTDVVKDIFDQPVRVLNELGIDYKMSRIKSQIKRLKDTTKSNLTVLDEDLFDEIIRSDVNSDVSMSYDRFRSLLNDNINEVCKKYAEFKLIYEDRFFKISTDGDNGECVIPDIDCLGDYKSFIEPSYYKVSYDSFRLDDFLESDCEGYISYYSHPYFLRYISVFAVFDLLADYLFVSVDEKNQRDAEEKAQIKRFHDRERLNEFYAKFR